jgi:uncharacterized protein
VIDDHAHPFPLEFEPFDTSGIGLEVDGGDAAALERRRRLAPGRLYVHLIESRLAELLDVPGGEGVAAARDDRARQNWPAYVQMLFDDAGLTGMILDDEGHPDEPTEAASRYAALAGRPIWKMARLDPLVDALIEQGAGATEIVDQVGQHMAAAAEAGAVAFKTILAYRTGLAVDPNVDLGAAQRSLDEDFPVRRRAKALRDLVLRTALGRAADLGLPLQVHTGFGDSQLRLAESDPLLLEEVLRTAEGRAATVVLIHGSFPWHEQAAYLASVKPNVWLELSLSNLFAPLHTADRLLRILDVAPSGRVLLGSDGHGSPETHWFGCRVLREAWVEVAAGLAAAGAKQQWIESTRLSLFERNAMSVYGLA